MDGKMLAITGLVIAEVLVCNELSNLIITFMVITHFPVIKAMHRNGFSIKYTP
jgi:hypothetical protein